MKATIFLCCLLSSVLLTQASDDAVDCGDVTAKSAPCVPYVTGKAPQPAPACCAGLKQLAAEAVTVTDRRDICRCLENSVKAIPGIQDKLLREIPGLCGIKIGFPISIHTNCDKIN